MTEEDSSAVGDVLERVLSSTVSREGYEPSTTVPSPTTPQSLDYGDDNEPEDDSKENHTVQNGIGRTSGCGNVLTDEADGLLSNEDDIADFDDEINEDPDYLVERVVDKRIEPDGRASYYVKWKNYPSSSNSWEPVEHLGDCDKHIEDFEVRTAEEMAQKYASEDEQTQNDRNAANKKKRKFPLKEYEVNDVMGITMVGDEKYFLVSLSNSTQKTFIRATLANKIVPQKVIDFYIKSMRWRST